jgi:hypothetical protein
MHQVSPANTLSTNEVNGRSSRILYTYKKKQSTAPDTQIAFTILAIKAKATPKKDCCPNNPGA